MSSWERVPAFQQADVAGQARRCGPDVAKGCAGQLGEGAAVIGRQIVAGHSGQIGNGPEEVEKGEEEQQAQPDGGQDPAVAGRGVSGSKHVQAPEVEYPGVPDIAPHRPQLLTDDVKLQSLQ